MAKLRWSVRHVRVFAHLRRGYRALPVHRPGTTAQQAVRREIPGMHAVRTALPLYRITLCGQAWHVVRPRASLAHAFADLDQAFAFVRTDCGGAEATVELLIENFYMVKQVGSGR